MLLRQCRHHQHKQQELLWLQQSLLLRQHCLQLLRLQHQLPQQQLLVGLHRLQLLRLQHQLLAVSLLLAVHCLQHQLQQ
jgi:hypothetical protein